MHTNAAESKREKPRSRKLTVAEAAEELGVKQPTIRAWVAKKRISHFKLGRSIRISMDEIERLLRQSFVPARSAR